MEGDTKQWSVNWEPRLWGCEALTINNEEWV